MKEFIKTLRKGIFHGTGIFLGLAASALMAVTIGGVIKTWTTGESLTAADLNTTITSLRTAIEGITEVNVSNIYQANISTTLNPLQTRMVSATCNDANDIALNGRCSATPANTTVMYLAGAANNQNAVNIASWSCGAYNSSTLTTSSVTAVVFCLSVP